MLIGECRQTNIQWTESLSSVDSEDFRPKPDITYAFPVSRNSDSRYLPLTPVYDYNFSVDFLSQSGLKCLVTNKIIKNTKQYRQHDLMCYPWAIVEIKRDRDVRHKTMHCYRQAVAAAAVALNMRADLYQQSLNTIPNDILPVITFTCIGPCVRVWLAWREQTHYNGSSTVSTLDHPMLSPHSFSSAENGLYMGYGHKTDVGRIFDTAYHTAHASMGNQKVKARDLETPHPNTRKHDI